MGDIRAMEESPDDELLNKVWMLQKIGFEEQTLIQGLDLVRNCSWSQVSTEQGHQASSAIIKRHRAGMYMMQVRSMLGQMRCCRMRRRSS